MAALNHAAARPSRAHSALSALSKAKPREIQRRLGIDEAARRILLYGVMPTWIAAGVADWWHHRRTRIERTSGTRESAIHSLMMAEAGLPTFLGLFAEINAGVLATATGTVAMHEATAYWDVHYAQSRRYVSPGEQQIHSLLEVVPMAATTVLLALHWDQALSLAGRGKDAPDLRLRAKSRPLSVTAKAAVLGSTALFIALPYAEELVRCVRAARRPATATPATQSSRPPQPSPSMTNEG